MTKTFIRIEKRKKWNSPQFVRPGIGVKKFTRAVFREQTHFFFSPESPTPSSLLKLSLPSCNKVAAVCEFLNFPKTPENRRRHQNSPPSY